jgi:hypothetical protein
VPIRTFEMMNRRQLLWSVRPLKGPESFATEWRTK